MPKKQEKMNFSELALIDLASKLLIETYGYAKDQIATYYKIKDKNENEITLDVVVLNHDKTEIDIIVEAIGQKVDSIAEEFEVEEFTTLMQNTTAKYGIIFFGTNHYFFKKIYGNNIIEVSDIPNVSGDISKKQLPIENVQKRLWRIFDILRGHIDASEYLEIVLTLFYVKLIDETKFDNQIFSNLGLEKKSQIDQLSKLFTVDESNLDTFSLEKLEKLDPNELTNLLYAVREFSISQTNPDAWNYAVFKFQEQLGFKSNVNSLPESVTGFIYQYITTGGNTEDLKFRNIAFGFLDSGKIIFDFLNFITDDHDFSQKQLEEYAEQNLSIIEPNITKIKIVKLLLALSRLKVQSHIEHPEDIHFERKFDCIVTQPPFNWKIQRATRVERNFENHELIKMIELVRDGGFLVAILPPSFLFSNDARNTREIISNNCYIRGIIHLPSILQTISIRPVMLLLQKKYADDNPIKENYKVFMSDIDINLKRHERFDDRILSNVWEKFMELQLTNKIKDENDSWFAIPIQNLVVDRWTLKDKSPMMKRILEINNPIKLKETVQAIISGKDYPPMNLEFKEIPIIKIGDIESNGLIKTEIIETARVPKKDFDKGKIPIVKENDILFSIRGKIGKVGLVTKSQEGATINQNLVILRPHIPSKDASFLLYYLKSEIVRYQLEHIQYGSVIFAVRIKDLENLLLPKPDGVKIQKINELKKEIEKYRKLLLEAENKLNEIWSIEDDN
ncbi:hypothetical protein Nlim_1825 [Candidatus Nitrosarchaeum limnium SFB1]|jgi:hypothetical protein|uniref:Uncharacterized protein n=1 Tax=Candidatus Nitrosarchaeum limnium SFB1 TaxID=886738 RepID=F3KMS0_9ARCH|nr:hypothetical protein Nlim_1825 [Candidatus Nitrosarchaeum limnium SFB1]